MVPENQASRLLVLACGVMLIVLGLAMGMPMHFWGINFAAYISPIYLILVLVLAAIAPWGLLWANRFQAFGSPNRNWVWSLGVALGMWALFYNLVIETDLYGDARWILTLGDTHKMMQKFEFADALSPQVFSLKNGENFTHGLVTGIRTLLGCKTWGAYRVLSAGCGLLYSFVWMQFVLQRLQTLPLRVIGAVVGLSAGITQVFYGHAEVYAAPILLITSYLIALIRYLEAPSRGRLLWCIFLLLLCIRAHTVGFAMVPTLAYALAVRWAGRRMGRWTLMLRRWPGLSITLSCLVVGALVFLTVFRAGSEGMLGRGRRSIFLALVPDGTTDNAYALLSPWHWWDLGQEFLLCSLPAAAILLAWLLGWRPRQPPQRATVIALSMAAFLTMAAEFVIDPYLSMPRDWDLYGLFAPPLLLLTVVLLSTREQVLAGRVLPQTMIWMLAIAQASIIIVNHDRKAVHRRLVDVAMHAFITKKTGSVSLLTEALDAMKLDAPSREALAQQVVADLMPHETGGNRGELAQLCLYAGQAAMEARDDATARHLLTDAQQLSPHTFTMQGELAVLALHGGDAAGAMQLSTVALEAHPELSGNHSTAIEAALELGDTSLAARLGDDYLRRFPQDPHHLAARLDSLCLYVAAAAPGR